MDCVWEYSGFEEARAYSGDEGSSCSGGIQIDGVQDWLRNREARIAELYGAYLRSNLPPTAELELGDTGPRGQSAAGDMYTDPDTGVIVAGNYGLVPEGEHERSIREGRNMQ